MSTQTTDPKYPEIEVQLTGEDCNAFSVVGRVCKAMRSAGVPQATIDEVANEMMDGDYDHLLRVATEWVHSPLTEAKS